jgi:hypothetical protein
VSGWIAASLCAVCVVLVLVVLRHLRALRRSVDDLAASVGQLSDGAATVDDLRAAVAAAVTPQPEPEAEPAPVTRVPQVLRTGPVIKAMALGSGTAHVARRLRGTGNGNGNGRDH